MQRYTSSHALLSTIILVTGVFLFWYLFGCFFVTFNRDDNLGGLAPVVLDIVDKVLQGEMPLHTYFLGGGGGLNYSLTPTGMLNPFFAGPAFIFHNDPHMTMITICALHLAIFAAGLFLLSIHVQDELWSGLIAGISGAFSGFFFIWSGNWATLLIPYSFLPFFLIGIIRLNRNINVIASGILTIMGFCGILLTGLPHAAFYQAFVTIPVLIWQFTVDPVISRSKYLFRLCIVAAICALITVPPIYQNFRLYSFFGTHNTGAEGWNELTVPLQAYLSLFFPQLQSLWSIEWIGLILMSGAVLAGPTVPSWIVLAGLIRQPRLLYNTHFLPFIASLIIMVLFLSPDAFGLQTLFSCIPIVKTFRWPIRGIPAFQVIVIVLFLLVMKQDVLKIRKQNLVTLALLSLILGLWISFQEYAGYKRGPRPGLPVSWFSITPFLDDQEEWSPKAMKLLRNSGFLTNICSSEGPFLEKPRLFMYGNLGALYKVPTLHFYMTPLHPAYNELGMTAKGCMLDWNVLKKVLEVGPKGPLLHPVYWDNPLGPETMDEIVRKTYISAIAVDTEMKEPLKYLENSNEWSLVEKRQRASLFMRKALVQ